MKIQPLLQFPDEVNSAAGDGREEMGLERARLLELRTESGPLYVYPSRWQRLRLLWIFRHFHVLSPLVLSRRDQRLIEKLSRSAVVTPPGPVIKNAVLGVLEKPRAKSPGWAGQVVPIRASPAKPGFAAFSGPAFPNYDNLFFEKPGPRSVPVAGSLPVESAPAKKEGGKTGRLVPLGGFSQWRALGVLAAACLLVVLGRFYVVSWSHGRAPQRIAQAAAVPVRHTATRIPPPSLSLPAAQKPKRHALPAATETTPIAPKAPLLEPAAIASAGVEKRPYFSELPQGHFAEPVVSDPNRVGELDLKALIGADGSVKEVTIVRGDPMLAKAGMRAVRRWHYSQYQALGLEGEAETLIKMNFFGQDAVSVTSIAR